MYYFVQMDPQTATQKLCRHYQHNLQLNIASYKQVTNKSSYGLL